VRSFFMWRSSRALRAWLEHQHSLRRSEERTAVAAVCLVAVLSGCFESTQGHEPRDSIETTAARYADAKLGVAQVKVLRVTHPTDATKGADGSCAMVEVDAPGVGRRRVILIKQGSADEPWEAVAVSERFQWGDFIPDSDGGCGLLRAGIRF
jgi:hypothetical protein